jgi:DNA-binding response OmpR family regulator
LTSRGTKSYTVLLVDDDPRLLRLLTYGLELLGHFGVVCAENGIEGLEQFFAVRPDCVVIDVVMPGMNGYQLVKALRGDPTSAATPLVLLTALAQEKNQFAGLASGADRYLVKPVTPRELVRTVQEAIMISEAERTEGLYTLLKESDEFAYQADRD